MAHPPYECLLTYMTPYVKLNDCLQHDEQLCEQFYADRHLDGINGVKVKKARRGSHEM